MNYDLISNPQILFYSIFHELTHISANRINPRHQHGRLFEAHFAEMRSKFHAISFLERNVDLWDELQKFHKSHIIALI